MLTNCLRPGLAAVVLAAAGMAGSGTDAMHQRQPVLVELFTSEGCSSCPPADALLQKLDREQPVAGAQIVVLSEHVDYWNHLGWTDPYSSAAVTARQVSYDRRFGLDGPYTPEMVVDGAVEFVGADAQKAQSVIRQAAGAPKVAVRIRAEASAGQPLTVEVDPLPEGKVRKANVYVVVAADSGTSDVQRGENRGRTLHHVAIAGEIRQVGHVTSREGFKAQVPVRAPSTGSGSRLVVFVQEPGNGQVMGAAMSALPPANR